jgi:two-component system sensor histidine kinase RegB
MTEARFTDPVYPAESTVPPTDTSGAMQPEASHRIHARLLVRLRWYAIAAQVLTGVVVSYFLHLDVRGLDFALVVLSEVLFNLVAMVALRDQRPPGTRWIAFSLVFDLSALTTLLFVSGGALNPFTVLFIIQVALGALMLPPRGAVGVLVWAAMCFAVLFVSPSSLYAEHHAPGSTVSSFVHLGGMWFAWLVAATFVAAFVGRLVRDLQARDKAILAAEASNARSRRLTSLAALAAGAAHEISTPLSTIAIAAGELQHPSTYASPDEVVEEARLIRDEVERCRMILDRLSAQSGHVRGQQFHKMSASDFTEDALSRLRERTRVNVHYEIDDHTPIDILGGALTHALTAVLHNALLADETKSVELRFARDGRWLRITVADEGTGMSPEILERASEPFFTTRTTGEGMGLGLFLAHNVASTLGGKVEIESTEGVGTKVAFCLPWEDSDNDGRALDAPDIPC